MLGRLALLRLGSAAQTAARIGVPRPPLVLLPSSSSSSPSSSSSSSSFSQVLMPRAGRSMATSTATSQGSGSKSKQRHWPAWLAPSAIVCAGVVYVQHERALFENEQARLVATEGPDAVLASTEAQRRQSVQVTLLRTLPTRALSRVWGAFHELELPVWIRAPVYKTYAAMFGCNLDEMAQKDLSAYPNLSAFFMRHLVENARPIASSLMVSPADGKVLHFGVVDDDVIEQVKGVPYSLQHFLGETPKTERADRTGHSKPGDAKKLFHIIIYLAPGDYHRFHSPAQWTATKRKHFPGELLSVAPAVAEIIAGLFAFNERVVLLGKWAHGFFSFSAVGAYNVGSILINMDKDLMTNRGTKYSRHTVFDKELGAIAVGKGEEIGTFNLGSTLILIFEAPADFQFSVSNGQKLQVGQPLGDVVSKEAKPSSSGRFW